MEIGEFVTSKLYPEKKKGRIVGISCIGGENFCDVYFPSTREELSLKETSLLKISTSTDRMKEREYDHPLLFQLRILSEKIESLIFQDKIISANNFNIIPLPHQVLTVNHVLEQFKPRCLIADEVGLGKTIEAALIFEELKMRKMVKRVLIIAPSGLTNQWKDELQTKFNEEFLIMNRDSFIGLQNVHGENNNVWAQYDQVITSIDFVKPTPTREHLTQKTNERREWHNKFITQDCVDSQWDMVIFDESHNLSKNLDGNETARYKIGKEISDTTPILLLLTATPHQGDSERFRHLLRLIDEYRFFADGSLTPENVKSVTIKNHKRAVTDFNGNLIFKSRIVSLVKVPRDENDIEAKLYDRVSDYVSKYYNLASREGNFPFMFLLILYQRMVSSSSRAIYYSLNKRLNILKEDLKAAKYLKKMDMSNIGDFEAQEAYDEILDYQSDEVAHKASGNYKIEPYMREEIDILTECVDLAKKSASGRQDFKLKKLLEIIDDVIARERDPKVKFIIFTEFIETQNYIGGTLESLGYKVAYFNGRMNLEEKIQAKAIFKEDHQFLVSTDSGGEGINLQFCHVMINYDLPWNPMKIEQRIGRIDRIGQEKDVLVFNFVLEKTIEERVRDILDHKLGMIADEFGDDKRRDVLSLLQDEYNFDKIFMEAIRERKVQERELERIGSEMYVQAKKIIEKQDLLVPFTEDEDRRQIENYMVEDERTIVENLVRTYARYKEVEIIEYSKKKDTYYFEHPINGMKLRNMVFDREIAIENEKYHYINLNHPLVKSINKEIMENDSLSFDLEIGGYSKHLKGTLFYYRLELTNNEGFLRRYLMSVFINQRGIYDSQATQWFESNHSFDFKIDLIDDMMVNIEFLKKKAEKIRDAKIKDFMVSTQLELHEKIEKEKENFEKYFKDKEVAIEKIAIDNIREHRLRELYNHREQERIDLKKKMNLVPQINLFAVAEVTLRP